MAIVRENTTIEFLNLKTLEIDPKSISVLFSPNNKLCFMDNLDEIIVYGSDHSVRIFGISDKSRKKVLIGHSGIVTAVLNYQESGLITVGLDGNLKMWENEHKVCLQTHKIMKGEMRFMDISKDGRLLLTCSDLYNIGIYDLSTLKKVWEYEDH